MEYGGVRRWRFWGHGGVPSAFAQEQKLLLKAVLEIVVGHELKTVLQLEDAGGRMRRQARACPHLCTVAWRARTALARRCGAGERAGGAP
eukprot:3978537-Prorocentrum_lima.AAC.1